MMKDYPEAFSRVAQEWAIRYARAPREASRTDQNSDGGSEEKADEVSVNGPWATAESDQFIMTPSRRSLCDRCAKINWSFHLGRFNGSPIQGSIAEQEITVLMDRQRDTSTPWMEVAGRPTKALI